ncbi:MAG TPA: BON domain-containing protein [Methylomirabilota bacterium]
MTHRLTILVAVLGVAVLTGCQTTTGRTAGTLIDDSSTTAEVKSKLVADRPANLTAVGVDTVNGVIYLTGVVDTPEQRMRAEQLAWGTAGVRQVVNNVQVQRPPIAAAPSAAVSTAPAATVRRGAVVGTVSSVDAARNQVTVSTGTEQLLLQLPPGVVRDLRPGDQISLDMHVQPAR